MDAERWHNEGQPPRGWQGNVSPDQYADQMVRYVRGLDARVVAVLPFLTDYRSREWASFDTDAAHVALLQRAAEMVPEGARPTYTVHLPKLDAPTFDHWTNAYPHVLAIEGGLSLDPNDPGNWRDGKLVGTKYGISAAVWGGQYDIPSLTEAQALDIYRQHYWQAAGCDALPWPLCLVHFDASVNHGVGMAREFLARAESNPVLYLALRLEFYAKLHSWTSFSVGWTRRIANLLRVVAAG